MNFIFETPPNLTGEIIDMWLHNGLFVGRYKENAIISEKAAIQIWQDREMLCNGIKTPTLWDCRKVQYWTHEGRKFQSGAENFRMMKAAAVVLPNSHVAVIGINVFLKFYNPAPMPSKFFTNIEDGFEWIGKFVQQ